MTTVLTGLKPTGELTIGNYIGAIIPMMEMQKKYDRILLFVADLHACTVPQDPNELHKRIRSFMAMYIACGIDPEKVIIYIQSENEFIPAISWLLECTTQYGEASRMIQFKEKSQKNSTFSLGLLTYPVLMAADILFCDATYVPVGVDQKQHVELTRDIAQRFNNKYGETFALPEPLINEVGTKIKDLKDPTKKMSKTDESPNGVITMFDDSETIRKKIARATTDSDNVIKYDEENKPGIANLISIAVIMTGKAIKEIEKEFENKTYGEFKQYVADVIIKKFEPIQKRYAELINSKELDRILDEGLSQTKTMAQEKYELMKKNMGLQR